MAIRTHQSISGFVAWDPQLSYTERGDARLYMKVGIEHYRKDPDKTFTQLETTFHDLIAYRGAAEQGAERLAKGDNIIADGRVRDYSYDHADDANRRLCNQALFRAIYIDEDNDVCVGYRNPYDGLSVPASTPTP